MKNDSLKKRYITILSHHLTTLGYPVKLKGDVSRYTKVGESNIRISDHVGFDTMEGVNVIVNSYTKDIIVIVNSQINVYHSIKEAKDFLTSFIYLHETKMTMVEGKDGKISTLKSQLAIAENEVKSLQDKLNKANDELQAAKELLVENKSNSGINIALNKLNPNKPYSTDSGLYLFNANKLTVKGKQKFGNAVATCIVVATTPKNIK